MKKSLALLSAVSMLALLGACSEGDGTNPFNRGEDTTPEEPTDGGETITTDPIDGDLTPPPGTSNPTPNSAIVRYEAMDEDGNGFALRPMYHASADTFSIDNLAFDGANTYTRDAAVASLGPSGGTGPFAVYEGATKVVDPVNGKEIDQLQYKAIYAVSTSGATEVAVIRTGGYIEYGFGGYIYQRNDGNSVVIPSTGQARFEGSYAGLRDFKGKGGLEYAVAKITVDVDFEDFDGDNAQDAVKGRVYDRRVYDTDGNDITQTILDALTDQQEVTYTTLPVLMLDIGPNTVDANGEVVGAAGSRVVDKDGKVTDFETGSYYAVLSGANPNEITGIFVTEHDDPRFEDVTTRETGAFTADR